MQTTDHAQDRGPNQTDHTNGFSSNSSNPRRGNRKHPDPGKGFTITGANGAPIEIPAGEFYFNTKARARRMMQNSLTSEARQVYACLELHTMGWQQEIAVIMEAAKVRPLTTSDIAAETGLSPRYVRYALQELEEQGLVERREIIAGKGLTKDNVVIYSWATPRQEPRRTNGEGSGSALPLWPEWFPESWDSLKPLIKHRKLVVSIDEAAARGLFTEGEAAARAYESALEAAARFLERVCARSEKASHNKEERTERTSERTDEAGRQAEVQVKFEASLPACPPSDRENNSEHTTPPAFTAAQILTLPSVRQLQQKLADTIGPELLEKIVTQLGDGPLEEFDKRLLLKMASTKSLARLPSIAGDVRRAHALQIANQQAAVEIITRQRQEEEKRFIAQAKAEWHRYPEADRQMLRETYPEIEWG